MPPRALPYRSRWYSLLFIFVGSAALLTALFCFNRREPTPPTEIFTGIIYGCDRLEPSNQGSGLVHWVRIDLTTPGIELYVTPLDPAAQQSGWEYRLCRTGDVVETEHLAVAVNACLFASDSGFLRMPGDFARSAETVVSDHVVGHVDKDTYLLWFDDQLTPHLEPDKPPSAEALALAKWAVSGQSVGLKNGTIWWADATTVDARTAMGFDPSRKLLFLAVGEALTTGRMLEKLAELGATDAITLDGGGSSSMALGHKARNVCPGVVLGDWRPVATHFGVRARVLQ